MKSNFSILLLIILLTSCKDANQATIAEQKNSQEPVLTTATDKKATSDRKTKNNGTFLCKINGKDWSYTKASGIVSRHKKTKKSTAVFTFTKQLEKGKETVQLYYDGEIGRAHV